MSWFEDTLGGAAQISTAMRVLAEIIASDVSLLVRFNTTIDGVIKVNPKARASGKLTLDGLHTSVGGTIRSTCAD